MGIDPNNAEAIRRIFDCHIRTRALLEAEDFAERVVESAQPIGLEVVHAHSMGSCLSTLSIEQSRLVFQGPKMDHPFNIARSDLVRFDHGKIGRTAFAGFVVRYRTAAGEEKKLEMFPVVYTKKETRGPFGTYGGEPEDYEATAKLTALFARLIERFVR